MRASGGSRTTTLSFFSCAFFRSILIDDRQDLQEQWEAAGGIFVHHTSTKSTLEILKEKGVFACSDDSGGDGEVNDKENGDDSTATHEGPSHACSIYDRG